MVALDGRTELRGDLAGEAGLRVAEREQVEPLLVAAGRPGLDLDLRGLADDGEVLVFQIDLQCLAGDEEFLVAEHAELHLRRHVVLAAKQVELALENAAADVVRHQREHLLEIARRLLRLLLVSLEQRELVVGLGLEDPVRPSGETIEPLLGTVELPGQPVDLGHAEFRIPLADRAVEFLGCRDPLVERPGLRIVAAAQGDVGVGHEQAGLCLGVDRARSGIHPGQHQLRQFAGAVVVARLRVLADEPGGECRIEFLVHLRGDRRIRRVAIPGGLQLAGGKRQLRVVDRPARVVPRHRVRAAERQDRIGSQPIELRAGGFGQISADHLKARVGNRRGEVGLAGLRHRGRGARQAGEVVAIPGVAADPPELGGDAGEVAGKLLGGKGLREHEPQVLIVPATCPGDGRVAVEDREEQLQFLGREAIGRDLRDGAEIGRATPAARGLAPLEIGGEFLEEVGPLGGILHDGGIARNRGPAHRPGVEAGRAPGGLGRLHDLVAERLIGGEGPLAPLPDLIPRPACWSGRLAAVARGEQLWQLVRAQRIARPRGHRRVRGEPLRRGVGPLLLLVAAVLREGPVEPTGSLRLLDEHVVEKSLHRKLLGEALELAADQPLVVAGGRRMDANPRLMCLKCLRFDQLGEHLVADLLLLPAVAPAGRAKPFEERVGKRPPSQLREDALADRLVEGERLIAFFLRDAVPVPTRSAAEERRVDCEDRGRRAVGLPLRHLVGDHLPLEIGRIERGRPIGDEPCERGLAERRLLLGIVADELVGLACGGQIVVELLRLDRIHAAGQLAGERIGEFGQIGRGRHVDVERLLELLLHRCDRRGGLFPFRDVVGLRLVVGRGLGRRLRGLECIADLVGPLLEGGVRGRDHLAPGLLVPRHPVEAAEGRHDGRLVGGIGGCMGEDRVQVALSGRWLEDRDRRTDDRLGRPGEKRLVPVGVGGGRLTRKRLPDRPDQTGGVVVGALERAVPGFLLREVSETGEQVGSLRGGERIGRFRAVGCHAREERDLSGIDRRVGLVDEEGEPGRARGLLEDLRKLRAQLEPLVGRCLVGLPALPVDRL